VGFTEDLSAVTERLPFLPVARLRSALVEPGDARDACREAGV